MAGKDVLTCLARNRGRFCSAAMIAAEIGRPVPEVAAVLEELASQNLLAVRIAGAVLYKLDPVKRTEPAPDEGSVPARKPRS